MKKPYELRHGVVLAEIYGESYLIATREARGAVDPIRSVNVTGAYFWRLLEQQLPFDAITAQAAEDYGITEQQAGDAFRDFFAALRGAGYVTAGEDAR